MNADELRRTAKSLGVPGRIVTTTNVSIETSPGLLYIPPRRKSRCCSGFSRRAQRSRLAQSGPAGGGVWNERARLESPTVGGASAPRRISAHTSTRNHVLRFFFFFSFSWMDDSPAIDTAGVGRRIEHSSRAQFRMHIHRGRGRGYIAASTRPSDEAIQLATGRKIAPSPVVGVPCFFMAPCVMDCVWPWLKIPAMSSMNVLKSTDDVFLLLLLLFLFILSFFLSFSLLAGRLHAEQQERIKKEARLTAPMRSILSIVISTRPCCVSWPCFVFAFFFLSSPCPDTARLLVLVQLAPSPNWMSIHRQRQKKGDGLGPIMRLWVVYSRRRVMAAITRRSSADSFAEPFSSFSRPIFCTPPLDEEEEKKCRVCRNESIDEQ